MRTHILLTTGLFGILATGLGACGGGGGTDDGALPDMTTTATADMTTAASIAIACTDTFADVYKLPTGLPAYDATHRGDVVRCAFDQSVSAATANTTLAALGYAGPPVKNGFRVYRIAFRTERVPGLDGKTVEGVSSALVMIPDKATPGALVVTAHGSAGLADKCAPSLEDQVKATAGDVNDARVMNFGLAGDGWVVIAPDYAGFGYGGPPQGWSLSGDEAHSVLDATRAAKKMLVTALAPQKVAIVGHSQGGHAALSAQALARSYGMEGTLVGTVGFAPLWIPPRSWGAAATPLAMVTTKANGGVIAYSLSYFYGHGEIYDGPGGGLAMFLPAKRDMVKTIMTTVCNDHLGDMMVTLGAGPEEIFDMAFINDTGLACGVGGQCTTADAMKWNARFKADRPASDPTTPLVVWQGALDTTIPPDRAQCGFDRLNMDFASATKNLTLCGDATATHGSVVRKNLDWVNLWIAARVNGSADPAACVTPPTLMCPGLPPNKD